jgi:nucleoside phosphorylase
MAKRHADLVIVTVNPHETKAVAEALQAVSGQPFIPSTIQKRVYHNFGSINGTRVFHVLSEMGSAGRGGTQRTVDAAIRAIKPQAVIVVGIAFGVNEERQRIGDVLISSQLWLYDLQRAGQEITPRGDKPHASTRLINFFESFNQMSWRGAKAKTGLILTGDKLVDNIDYRNQLLQFETEAIGGEMEGAGVYVSSEENKVDWIVIKAICDWADGKKALNKEERQATAAASAATFLAQALDAVSLIQSAGNQLVRTKAIRGQSTVHASTMAEFATWSTGDRLIDTQLRQLAAYDASGDQRSQRLIELLGRLFTHRAFLPGPEGSWREFAYVSSATRFILGTSLPAITIPKIERPLREAFGVLAGLEAVVEKQFDPLPDGEPFSLSRHIELYIQDKNQFIENLPRWIGYGNLSADPARDQLIRQAVTARISAIHQVESLLRGATPDQRLADVRENVGPSPEMKLDLDQAASGNGPNEADWSEELNERRIELIDKAIQGNTTEAERAELAELQRRAVAYRDREAPLPIEAARRLHQHLLETKRQREGS